MITLGEALPKEIERAKRILECYEELGPVGVFGACFISKYIKDAEKAISEQDTIAMLYAYNGLKEIKE